MLCCLRCVSWKRPKRMSCFVKELWKWGRRDPDLKLDIKEASENMQVEVLMCLEVFGKVKLIRHQWYSMAIPRNTQQYLENHSKHIMRNRLLWSRLWGEEEKLEEEAVSTEEALWLAAHKLTWQWRNIQEQYYRRTTRHSRTPQTPDILFWIWATFCVAHGDSYISLVSRMVD